MTASQRAGRLYARILHHSNTTGVRTHEDGYAKASDLPGRVRLMFAHVWRVLGESDARFRQLAEGYVDSPRLVTDPAARNEFMWAFHDEYHPLLTSGGAA